MDKRKLKIRVQQIQVLLDELKIIIDYPYIDLDKLDPDELKPS